MKTFVSIVIISTALLLSGCFSLAFTGATAVGYSAVQERTVGNAVDDLTISTQINSSFLQHDIERLFRNVDIEVHEGRVLLTGNVESAEDRVEAIKLAWQPEGVKEVINEIEVKGQDNKGTPYYEDAWISARVKAALFLQKDIRSINYQIDTVNKVVYLMGVAQDKEEIQRAMKVVSDVDGVKKVVNHMVIKSDPSRL